MADILLTVGVDTSLSYAEFQSGITSLVSKINSTPPKIKVQFDTKSAETALRQQISSMNASMKFTNAGSSYMQGLTNGAKNANAQISATKAHLNAVNAEKRYYNTLNQMQTALRNYTAAENSKNATSRSSYLAIQNEVEALKQSYAAYQNKNISLETFKSKVASASKVLASSTATIKANGDATKTLSERMGGLASKFGSWLTVSQAIMYAVRAMKQMVSASIELDTAMTELKKVTDESDATYDKFLDNAEARAKKIGASLSDVVTSSADFARLGYDIDDASKLADAALVYKNVGDGIEDISQASESIIATIQAFYAGEENQADLAMSVVDKFNEVGNNYAISSEGIGEALLRSAASMQAANNTLDETIALTAAANTIVQNPETVGEFAPNNTVMY